MLVFVKLFCTLLLLMGVLAFGFLPLLFSSTNKSLFSLFTSFSGGVLLGAVMVHMIPEAISHSREFLCYMHVRSNLPIGVVLVVVGFIIILFIEKLVEELRYRSTGEAKPLLQGSSDSVSEEQPRQESFGGYILIMALSLHSLFEGLAVGVAESVSDTFTLFLAVIIHKLCLAFAVGVKLQAEGRNLKEHFYSLLVYALSSPLGLLIGIIVTSTLTASNLMIATFFADAFASGTFLYITFIEVISPEFQTRHVNQLLKILALFGGFGVVTMSILLFHKYSRDSCT